MTTRPRTTTNPAAVTDGQGRVRSSIEEARLVATLQITGEWLSDTVNVKQGGAFFSGRQWERGPGGSQTRR